MNDRGVGAAKVAELIRELSAARSQREKLGVLARAWRIVRRLSPNERFEIAKQIGLEGAEELLGRLGDPNLGISPAELLEEARGFDAEDLSRFKDRVKRLSRPDKRQELLRKGLLAAKEVVLEEVTQSEETPPVPDEGSTAEAKQESAHDGEPATPGPPPRPVASEPTRVITPPAPPPTLGETPKHPAPAPPSRSPRPITTGPAGLRQPSDTTPPPETEPAVLSPVTTEPPPTAALDFLVKRLRASPSLATRLGILSKESDGLRKLVASEVERLLACFPEGWARRRALAAILRSGSPQDIGAAIDLVAAQETPSARLWCFSTLISRRDLTEADEEEILSREPSPAIRRRVAMRLLTKSGST